MEKIGLKLNILKLFIFFTIQSFHPHFAGALTGTYTCLGGGRSGPSVTQCIRGTSGQYACPASRTDPLRAAEGCEQDTASGLYYCCPQFCDDATTMIYYNRVTLASGQILDATPTCTGAGPCPTNSSEVCYQPNPTDSRYFCCPILSAGISPLPGAQQCADLAENDCLVKNFLCNDTLYFDLMTWQCPNTCGRCPADNSQPTRPPNIANPPLPNQNCQEMLNCPSWRQNGFCQNDFYSNDTKAAICPLTCQLGCALANLN